MAKRFERKSSSSNSGLATFGYSNYRSVSTSGYDFARFGQMPKTFNFNDEIDLSAKVVDGDSLAQLLDCLRLEYSDKLVTPRWKNFKSQNLKWAQKRRLNNIIWRAWHMQFQKDCDLPYCHFAIPLIEGTHNKPQAIIVEGDRWRRRIDAIASEYKQWRLQFRQTVTPPETETQVILGNDEEFSEQDEDVFKKLEKDPLFSFYETEFTQSASDAVCSVSDTLFTSLPIDDYVSTDERYMDTADVIQPTLGQLQPSFMDFWSTIESRDQVENYLPRKVEALAPFSFHAQPQNVLLSQSAIPSSEKRKLGSSDMERIRRYPTTPPDNTTSTQNISNVGYQESSMMLPRYEETTPSNYNSGMNLHRNIHRSSAVSESVQPINTIQTERRLSSNDSAPVITEDVRSSTYDTQSFNNQFGQPLQSQLSTVPNRNVQPANIYAKSSRNQIPEMQNSRLSQDSFHLYQNLESRQANIAPKSMDVSQGRYPADSSNSYNDIRKMQSAYRQQPNRSSTASPPPSHSSYGQGVPYSVNQQAIPVTIREQERLISYQTNYTSASSQQIQAPPASFVAQQTNLTDSNNPFLTQRLRNSSYAQESGQYQPRTIDGYNTKPVPVAPAQSEMRVGPPTSPVEDLSSGWSQVSMSTPNTGKSEHTALIQQSGPGSVPVSPTLPNPAGHVLESSAFSASESQPSFPHDSDSPLEGHLKRSVSSEEHRRKSHQSSEQKRRGNIKLRFESLQSLVPSLNSVQNARNSKATILQKSVEYCKMLIRERQAMQNDAQELKSRILKLNESINKCQQQLPATGATVTQQRVDQIRQRFNEYVKERTLNNYKFWIFSTIIRPLFESYSSAAATSNFEEFYRTVRAWMDQHCALPQLRPVVMMALCQLSKTTDILSNPPVVPAQAVEAARRLLEEPSPGSSSTNSSSYDPKYLNAVTKKPS